MIPYPRDEENRVNIVSVGGGPAGLYFAALMKSTDPGHRVRVFERNDADDTFGFGVVFSDATLAELERADAKTHQRIVESFAHWDAIDTHFGGEVLRSEGHGFSGMSRKLLLQILQERCEELNVELEFNHEVSDVAQFADADLIVAADGINSAIRDRYAETFRPDVTHRPNRFVWLGTTYPYEAFTFYFKANEHGLFRVHAYRYAPDSSTFIVECTEDTWQRAKLSEASEDDTIRYCEELFADELRGHRLKKNRSMWRSFPTVRNGSWHHENIVLLGDACHSAHFSIGSGTKLAMEDAIFLRDALVKHADIPQALIAYERDRKPTVASLQRAAQVSLEWFEHTERFMEMEPIQFGFSLLTRSLRVNHENLRVRDPAFVDRVNDFVRSAATEQSGVEVRPNSPPMFTPLKLRDLVLDNRVGVSAMCQYSATEGAVDDWHLVHLGSRALGGAAIVMTEMTDVSADGRITHGCAGLYTDSHVQAWQRIVRWVHDQSDAKIGVQLAHAGRKGATKLMWEGMDEPLEADSWPLLAASPIPYLPHSQVPKEMDRADMDQVRSDFVAAAQRAVNAEFDLLELHLAHGYLLASFISPLTNRRTDGYGGSIEGRMRYPLEVVHAVREVWPERQPLSCRISASDWHPDGISAADVIEAAKMLKAAGVDIVDVSAGQTDPASAPEYGRLFQTPLSELVRLEAGIPTMTVGNISSYSDVNSIIAGGRADLCLLARAHLFDPYWTRHAAAEQGYELKWPVQYASVQRYTARFK